MEASTTDVPIFALPEGICDSEGNQLSTGDRVHVTGSDNFGEGDGTVIGAMRAEDYRIVGDGELRQVANDKPVRIRIRMDNGHAGDEYHASAGRVTRIDASAPVAE